jgi:hypothetical protein
MGIYLAEVGQSDQIHNPPIPTEGRDARDTVAFLNAPPPWALDERRRGEACEEHDPSRLVPRPLRTFCTLRRYIVT